MRANPIKGLALAFVDQQMQTINQEPALKNHRVFDTEFSIRQIFEDNHNWDTYRHLYESDLREVEIAEVEKRLSCKDGSKGFFVYHCPNCNESHVVYLGCNSRLCSSCGKNYTDKWAQSLSKAMFDVVHRHVVLSVPDVLWPILLEHRELHKIYMGAAIKAINDTLSHSLRKEVTAGVIVVLHPFSRDLSFKPHIHLLVTEGGFDRQGRFIPKKFIPAYALRKTWQYQVLSRFKKALPKTKEMSALIDSLFKKYDGFYAHLPAESRITSKRQIARYVGRYVRHPAIANSRICGYDGANVTFWYEDNEDIRHYRTMTTFEFIQAIIQHIPERNFKMIRYYGAYCRKWKRRYGLSVKQGSITQSKLGDFQKNRAIKCPVCGHPMEFVMYWKKGPPEKSVFGGKIEDWNYISRSLG